MTGFVVQGVTFVSISVYLAMQQQVQVIVNGAAWDVC